MMSKSCLFNVDNATGLLGPATQCLSPNCDARPDGAEPSMIVLHGISLEEIRGIEVSTHVLIRRDGSVIQFVPFADRAWHAGESCFRGNHRCNDFSIGIELEGEDETPYDDRQYPVLQAVIQALCKAYPQITPREIAGHSDIAPGRKTDPGPAFDWLRLYDGLGHREDAL
jgi:AmpD protein